jgi:hypothetical protein
MSDFNPSRAFDYKPSILHGGLRTGYSSGPDGGYILVLTTGEDVVVTAKDNAANAKIKEFGFP